jgi:hypothetical protein
MYILLFFALARELNESSRSDFVARYPALDEGRSLEGERAGWEKSKLGISKPSKSEISKIQISLRSSSSNL